MKINREEGKEMFLSFSKKENLILRCLLGNSTQEDKDRIVFKRLEYTKDLGKQEVYEFCDRLLGILNLE